MKSIITLVLFIITSCGFSQSQNSILIVDSLDSKFLNETRKYFIYIPKEFDSKKSYPIIYCTDGQKIVDENYANLFDSLIDSESIKPTVFIGAFSNNERLEGSISKRQIEYIKGFSKSKDDKLRFENHKLFFINELPEYIFKKHGIKNRTNEDCFFGVSNGGGFGITLFLEKESPFEKFICLSPLGNTPPKTNKSKNEKQPYLYIGFGDKEPVPIVAEFERQIILLKKKKYELESNKYQGGHNDQSWKMELTRALTIK